MTTSRHIDRICIAIVSAAVLLTVLFMNGSALGIQSVDRTLGYEDRIFDTSRVHSIDIVMDDWESFIETCENEEYSSCTVVIDGEKYANIGIRAKGNTSLSQVKQMDSERYSFKLEFDQYDSSKSYYGLDKLCLNNLIQDNTMMKDYLVYRMMADFGVDSPLCSYTYITVNGEDWGLYLAVEGVEDAFLERNYGSDAGELYKPDSMSFGGGRGNGRDFHMEDFAESGERPELPDEENMTPASQSDSESMTPPERPDGEDFAESGERPELPDGENMTPASQSDGESMTPPERLDGEDFAENGERPELPDGENMTPASQSDSESMTPPGLPDGENFAENGERPELPDGENMTPAELPDGENMTPPEQSDGENRTPPGNMRGGAPGGMGSDDVKLKYIDDDAESYSNIFDNAKTEVTQEDQDRLIASLKSLNSYSDLEECVNTDEVLRYFVVHNFVCNGDSYTGSMIHNYYLYEQDGQLSMIPWDYNLAFGTFQGNNAPEAVNESIDNPVSGGDVDDRPMLGWIFSDASYTEQYHTLFEEFVERWFDEGELSELIESTADLIRPYVEKDPTRFCTTEEFEEGVEALEQFVTLRAEAVSRQLAGDTTAVDTEGLTLSDMGTMQNGGEKGRDR